MLTFDARIRTVIPVSGVVVVVVNIVGGASGFSNDFVVVVV